VSATLITIIDILRDLRELHFLHPADHPRRLGETFGLDRSSIFLAQRGRTCGCGLL